MGLCYNGSERIGQAGVKFLSDVITIGIAGGTGSGKTTITRKLMGQKIGDNPTAPVCAPVHSPVSGKVIAIEGRPHPLRDSILSVVIENDGLDTPCTDLAPLTEQEQQDPEAILTRVREAGVVGMLAICLFASVREKLEFADYPKCFEGFPICLVSAGLLSLAFMNAEEMSATILSACEIFWTSKEEWAKLME